jgi:putative iron-regulated protein
MLEDALSAAQALSQAINEFIKTPTEARLQAAKVSWLAARPFYQRTESMRFYAGPIDDDDGPEAQINAWPMDEQIIETMIADAATFPNFTPEILADQNQREGEKDITCGFHAIEFILWGPDTDPAGPGNRPLSDLTTSTTAKRRLAYLKACTELLVSDLQYVADDWKAGKLGNFRAMFVEGASLSLQQIFTGICLLAGHEWAGSRLQVAYDTQEQEEELSCFSDSTQADIVASAEGILTFWTGELKRRDGSTVQTTGLREIVRSVDAALADKLDAEVRNSVASAQAVPRPFDQAIRGKDDAPGRVAVARLIRSLEDQSELFREVARKLGYVIPMEPNPNAE